MTTSSPVIALTFPKSAASSSPNLQPSSPNLQRRQRQIQRSVYPPSVQINRLRIINFPVTSPAVGSFSNAIIMSSKRNASTKSAKPAKSTKLKATKKRKASSKRDKSPAPKRAVTAERKSSKKKATVVKKAPTAVISKTDDPKKNPYIVFKKPDLLLLAIDRGVKRAHEHNVPTLRRMLANQGKPFPSSKELARLRGPSPLPAFAPGLGLGATPPADADEEYAKAIRRADSMKASESDDEEEDKDDLKDEDFALEEHYRELAVFPRMESKVTKKGLTLTLFALAHPRHRHQSR